MRLIRSLFVCATLLAPSIAMATPDQPAPLPSEIRLSDAEKEKVLEAAAASKREHPAAIAEEATPQAPPIHGEVGFGIGTGGYRSAFGTATVPLDGDGFAAISLDTTDFDKRSRLFDPWLR
jgi:hypothetical protein